MDEPTYRAWRLFMSDLMYAFSMGSINAYQILLVKPKRIRLAQRSVSLAAD